MISKPLIIISLICNLFAFNLSANSTNKKIAEFYSREDYQSVVAAENISTPSNFSIPSITNEALYINAKNYLLVDGSGTIITGKDYFKPVPIASLTKIMTAIIALENYELDEIAVVPHKATTQIPTVVYLRAGEEITISELLHCLLIKSGNDAAYTIAAHMDKENNTPDTFVQKMNEKASDLGLSDTHFFDSAGLSDDGYSTAHDLSIITRYALKNNIFREIVRTDKYVATNITKTIFHQLENSNRLVTTYQYPGAIGVKTGFTYAASHCLIGAAERDQHRLIAIVLGTYVDSPTASAIETRKLLDWGFKNVIWPN